MSEVPIWLDIVCGGMRLLALVSFGYFIYLVIRFWKALA